MDFLKSDFYFETEWVWFKDFIVHIMEQYGGRERSSIM